MDIYCVRCGEPWDIDSLHEEVDERNETGETASFDTVRGDFYSRGCAALSNAFGTVKCERSEPVSNGKLSPAMAMSVLVDIMGDDIDGVAAMMEDYGY
jgi:hypothetical protein